MCGPESAAAARAVGRAAYDFRFVVSTRFFRMAARATMPRTVVVVGGGIIGCSSAFYLSKIAGVKVILVERTGIACAASGKAGGFLAAGWGDGKTNELHQMGFHLHEKLAAELGLKSYRKVTALSVNWSEGESQQASWIDKVSTKVMDTNTAQVTPLELTTKLWEKAKEQGATLVMGDASEVMYEQGRITGVRLRDGETVVGDDYLFAMGPWTVLLTDFLAAHQQQFLVPMLSIRSTSFTVKLAASEEEPCAVFCNNDPNNNSHVELYCRPPVDGFNDKDEVYVSGCGESEYIKHADLRPGAKYASADLVKPSLSRVDAACATISRLTSRMEGVQPLRPTACLRPCSDDGNPLMGRLGCAQNGYVCGGHNCWGILWGPASGKAMAELITGAEPCISLQAFDPMRFTR
eukprot:m.91317 g.91317  ORF g.91317 m.91317 type:complete len:407 (+) comp18213_c0_seq1:628-1848(+)